MEASWSRQQMLAELAAGRSGRSNSPLIRPGSEDEIQATFFQWIDLHKERFPELQACFAIPNAGFASKKQGALRKLTGRRAGIPDVCLPVPQLINPLADVCGSDYYALWIEFKVPGKKPTKEQLEWHARLRALGHRVEVCDTWTDGANIFIEYLNLSLEKL
jgi:hypothetical protein